MRFLGMNGKAVLILIAKVYYYLILIASPPLASDLYFTLAHVYISVYLYIKPILLDAGLWKHLVQVLIEEV